MRKKTLLFTGVTLMVLLVSAATVRGHDVPEEFDEFDELFEEFAEEFGELVADIEELADDPEELMAEIGELMTEFVAESDELVAEFGATTIPMVGVETAVSVGPPERVWESDGILHIRGQVARNVFVGTCGGDPCSFDVPFVLNVNLNLATGDGTIIGTWAYVTDGTEFTWGDRVGSFEGPFWATIDGATGVVTLVFTAQGSGDFEGMKVYGTDTAPEFQSTIVVLTAELSTMFDD